MPVRSTMASLIARVRILINDPSGASQKFDDQTIQDVLDESRVDMYNVRLSPRITYAPTVQFLDYFSDLGGWEEDYVFKQYLTKVVTPSTFEPIAGHFQFATSTYPPVYITGKIYDVYRASADLLERLAALSVLQFAFSSDGQSFQPQQVVDNVTKLVKLYRSKQRISSSIITRSDLVGSERLGLGATTTDYIVSGDN